ncbi:PIN domain-containing protein [soil metagenome]
MEFVDTNVLLYAYDVTAGARHERARELVGRLGRARLGALSVQVLQEFYVNAVMKIATPLTPEDARLRLRVLSRWPAHSPMPLDIVAASVISEDHQVSFWDAMIVRSASELGCTRLWTEDLNDGQMIAGVRVANPFA